MDSKESQMVTSAEEEEDSHCQYAIKLASASVLLMLLKAAMDLGMLEIIGRAGLGALLSPSEVAYHLPAHNHPDVLLHLYDHSTPLSRTSA